MTLKRMTVKFHLMPSLFCSYLFQYLTANSVHSVTTAKVVRHKDKKPRFSPPMSIDIGASKRGSTLIYYFIVILLSLKQGLTCLSKSYFKGKRQYAISPSGSHHPELA